MDRADKFYVELCTCDSNIQSPFTAHFAQGAEIHIHFSSSVPSIANAEYDGVALVALYIFKVFYEERLCSVL